MATQPLLVNVRVKCPYCAHEQTHATSPYCTAPQVVFCDPEDGGCEKYFGLTAKQEVIVTGIFKLDKTA